MVSPMSRKKSKGPLMQTVHITLSNGQKGIFTGPALVTEGMSAGLMIVGVVFSRAFPLPPGTAFEIYDMREGINNG